MECWEESNEGAQTVKRSQGRLRVAEIKSMGEKDRLFQEYDEEREGEEVNRDA